MSQIILKSLRKSYGAVDVVKSVDLVIDKGTFVVFVGPSGCGKTTLLRMIAGLDAVTSGNIFIDGRNVVNEPISQRGLAMVFQSYALYPHMTVRGNIGFPLKMQGLTKEAVHRKVEAVAETLNLTACLERKPKALSGGQRQRVAIGRAIVREPKAFLFDEPLSNLDAALRIQMRLELVLLQKQLSATTIYVTHDQTEAMTMADTIVVLNEGSIEQTGTPMSLYNNPCNLFVAGFIGTPKMNFIGGQEARRYDATTIGIRPEHLTFGDSITGWPGRIRAVEHLGSDAYVYVDTRTNGAMTIRCAGDSILAVGTVVNIAADPTRIHRFDSDGRSLHPQARESN